MNGKYPTRHVLQRHNIGVFHGRYQSGGKATFENREIPELRTFKYDGVRFNIEKTYEDDSVQLVFTSPHDRSSTACGYIILYKREARVIVGEDSLVYSKSEISSMAYLQSLDKGDTVSGQQILTAVIAYIRSIKDRYAIKYIQLQDTSHVIIRGTFIELADYYTFTHGETLYSKYGFIPFNATRVVEDKYGKSQLEQNRVIMKTKLLNECVLLSRYHSREPILLSEFMKIFITKSPGKFASIVEQLYTELSMRRFVGSSWYLPI